MRVLPSTIYQQQSFDPDWILDSFGVPAGLVTGCQFTTTSASPIYLRSLRKDSAGVSLVFAQDAKLCAYVTVSPGSDITAMRVEPPILSATVETLATTSVSDEDIIYTGNVEVNPTYIDVVTESANSGDKIPIIHITNTGYSRDVEVREDINIRLSDNLSGDYDNGVLTISMSDLEYENYRRLSNDIIAPPLYVTNINGLSSKSGNIGMTILLDGKMMKTNKLADNWIELDSSDESFCPALVDIIDTYISPSTHLGYLPLDDIYVDGVRNTDVLVSHDKKYGNPSNPNLSLTDVDPDIDADADDDDVY